MNTNTSQVQGVEVLPGWMIGRAPLALRGIRFADGGDGGNGGETPPAPPAPAAPAPPAPTPPADPAPTPQQQRHSDYDPVWAKALREEAKGYREAGEQTAKDLAAEKAARAAEAKELEELRAEKAERTRREQLTGATKDIADLDALLDSAAFGKALEGVDLADADKLGAAVKAFVEEHPRFALQDGPKPPPRAPQGTPTGGGGKTPPRTLSEAISSEIAARQ
ncbi:hypothetical protein PQI23_13375 [Leucobacter sp. USCH14]|uniref:hypothetical protein n=1 Tax=Leucobacter sp. USCH14 TaxID=3024838 RepID=UPI0030AF9EBE